jgi:pimeloyl-ACP methyl ester carboxylesterase
VLDPADVDEVATIWQGLRDRSTRAAFLRTLRSVVDLRGQSVTSRDRLYLATSVPTLLVWGSRDPVIPVAHAREAVECLPGAVLEVLERSGHLPHRHDPAGFAAVVTRFLATTEPAEHDARAWRDMLEAGGALPVDVVEEQVPVPA